MSTPKLLSILEAITLRLQAVSIGNGYQTNAGQQVVRGKNTLDGTGLPGFAVYLESRSAGDALKQRAAVECSVVVEAIAEFGNDHPEDVACRLAADIQQAMESGDRTLDGLVLSGQVGGLAWQSDEFVYPEDNDTLVGVRVSYAVPHIRRPGDPIN